MIGFLVATATAIGVARLAPEGRGWRMPCLNTCINVPAAMLGRNNEASRWLDVNRGEIVSLELPRGDALLFTSSAPWVDDRGQSEAVGLWVHYQGNQRAMSDMGLARVSFPDGEVREIIHTDIVPTSVPTWYPGTASRVLYSAGDGKLYQYEFGSDSKGAMMMATPEMLTWECEVPSGGVIMSDPHWVLDPRLENVVLVSLRERESGTSPMRMGHSRLWWLKLSDDGRKIVAAGKMGDSKRGLDANTEERYPTTGKDASGQVVLVYQRKVDNESWDVYATPFRIDSEKKEPLALPNGQLGRKLAHQCYPVPTLFSKDGRWVGVIGVDGEFGALPRRVPLEPPLEVVSLSPSGLTIAR